MGDTGDKHQRGLVKLPLPLKNRMKPKSTPAGCFFCVHKNYGRGRAPPLRTIKNPLHRADRGVRPYNPFRRGRCPHRPAPPHYLLPTRRGRRPRRPAFAHLHVMRRAGCPQPAARQPPPPGRARGPCPTKKYHCRVGSMCPRTSCKKQKTAQRFTLHGYFSDTVSSRP